MQRQDAASIALFLFAHQDDEFGVFSVLECAVQQGQKVVCVYLTSGVSGQVTAGRRNREAITALGRLGIPPAHVHFLGLQTGIPDGALHRNLQAAYDAADALVAGYGAISGLYVPAWEGGHQDHDSAHVIGAALAQRHGWVDRTYQFPMYHGAGLPGSLFWVTRPLPANGPVIVSRIPFAKRVFYLSQCLAYTSQWKTWVGLFPFVLIDLLVHGVQRLQRVNPGRLAQSPHSGRLLYERRRRASAAEALLAQREFLAALGVPLP